jgi:large subunit ribosomal protein L19
MISAKFSASGAEQEIHIGDTLRVHSKVVEGAKSRVQIFEGILIRLQGRAENMTFTVRKIGAAGIGVERIWPLNANSLVRIEVKKSSAKGIRRSKLYYLRGLTGKSAVRV